MRYRPATTRPRSDGLVAMRHLKLPARAQTWVAPKRDRWKSPGAGGNQRFCVENVQVTRLNPKITRVVASLAIAVGFVAIALGLSTAVTGRDAAHLPDQIESVQPVRNATQVLSQDKVVVDLVDGYTGELVINNIQLPTFSLDELPPAQPGQQQTLPKAAIFEPGNSTLSFTPSDGAPIEKFVTGVNTVTVRFWKIVDGPNFAKSFTWQFDVV